jgi:hypothetical protein
MLGDKLSPCHQRSMIKKLVNRPYVQYLRNGIALFLVSTMYLR